MLESALQTKIKEFLEDRGWFVANMHGNAYQKGIPDSYCEHLEHKMRWVEVKRPDKPVTFTPDQKRVFPQILAKGRGIWIIRDATLGEYRKLFLPCNIREFHPFRT